MKLPPLDLDLDFAAGRDEAPAIACDGERLSYADLRRRAAAIAARLGGPSSSSSSPIRALRR